jgi:PAS domain S-box-containing protein
MFVRAISLMRRARDIAHAVVGRAGAWQPRRGLWPTGLILAASLAAAFAAWRLVTLNASLAPFAVLVAGALASWLMAALAWSANRRRLDAREAAERLEAALAGRRRSEDALRESEARLQRITDDTPIMVWMTEADGRCTFLSKSWYAFTSRTPAETSVGFGWADAIHPDDRERAKSTFLAANAKQAPFRQEYRLRRYDGAYRWALDTATPNVAADGRFGGYIGSVVDIDERKRAEAANARVAAIVQAAHDAIVGVSLDGTIELWNAAPAGLTPTLAACAAARASPPPPTARRRPRDVARAGPGAGRPTSSRTGSRTLPCFPLLTAAPCCCADP